MIHIEHTELLLLLLLGALTTASPGCAQEMAVDPDPRPDVVVDMDVAVDPDVDGAPMASPSAPFRPAACSWNTQALTSLDSAPPQQQASPREILAPIAAGIDGILTRPSGSTIRLRFEVTFDAGSARLTTSPDPACPGASIGLQGSLRAEGGQVFSGEGPARIAAADRAADGLIAGLEFVSTDFETSLDPPENPCTKAVGLRMQLKLDANCMWSADWRVHVPLLSMPGQACDKAFPEPLGTFSAPGSCE